MPATEAFFILGLALGFANAQSIDSEAEEAAIRKLIANPQQMIYSDDVVFWTGAYKRPSIGRHTGEPFSATSLSQRKNQTDRFDVQCLEVAMSGDMAYEYSCGKLEFDTGDEPAGHIVIQQGIVRVWKKLNGEWKVVVAFIRPLDQPFDHSAPVAGK
jgi:ketosteroid isomerase-like protein